EPEPTPTRAARTPARAPGLGGGRSMRSPDMAEGGPGRDRPHSPAAAPPEGDPPDRSGYFCGFRQRVNDWSPNRNLAQLPLIETSLKLSSKVSPSLTVYTVPSTSTCALVPPAKMSSSTTVCPPIVVLWPPLGEEGGEEGGLPDGAEVGLTLPLGAGVAVCRIGGIENGSRAPARTTGGSVSRGVGAGDSPGDGAALGLSVATGEGDAVSVVPPPPPSTLIRTKATIATPATTPRMISARRSRGESAISSRSFCVCAS